MGAFFTRRTKHTIDTTPLLQAACNCPICMDPITKKTGVSTLACGHSFHLSCISQWLQDDTKTCPMCRGAPTKYEVARGAKEVSETVTLDVSWRQGERGEWMRLVRVVSEPVVWRPGSGPKPISLEQWLTGSQRNL
jgi:hypothetical protein